MHGARRGARHPDSRAARPRRRTTRRRSPRSRSTAPSPPRSTSSSGCSRPPSSAPTSSPRLRAGLRARRSAWPTRSAAGSSRCSARRGLVVYDCVGSRRQAAGEPGLRARAGDTGRDLAARRAGRRRTRGARLPRAGADAAAMRCALFHLSPRPRSGIRQQDGHLVVGDERRQRGRTRAGSASSSRTASARTCCSARSCRTRSSRPSVTWPGRTSWRTSASCAASTSTSACRCRSCIPRASATLLDSAALRFLGKYDVALEALQPQDEAALNALLAAQIPRARRRRVRRGRARHRRRR